MAGSWYAPQSPWGAHSQPRRRATAAGSLPNLEDRVAALEQRTIGIDDLPISKLQDRLERDWQPEQAVLLPPGAWFGVAYATNYADYGGTDQPVQFRKVGDAVEMRGIATRSTGTMTTGDTVTTLPTDCRPPAIVRCAVPINGGIAEINISTAGAITVAFAFATAETDYISFDGVRFYT